VAKGSNECSTASYGLYTGKNGGLLFYVGNGQAYGFTVTDEFGYFVKPLANHQMLDKIVGLLFCDDQTPAQMAR
jgi:hypothetical protein